MNQAEVESPERAHKSEFKQQSLQNGANGHPPDASDSDDERRVALDVAEQAQQQLLRLPVEELLGLLNRRHQLELDGKALQEAARVLRLQWFEQGADLEGVDRQTLFFLNLPAPLQRAILETLEKQGSSSSRLRQHLHVDWAVPVFSRGQAFGPFGGTTSGLLLQELAPAQGAREAAADDAKSESGRGDDPADEKEPEAVPSKPEPPAVKARAKAEAAPPVPSRPGCSAPLGQCVMARRLQTPSAADDLDLIIVPVSGCQHQFCRGCLRAYLMQRVAQKKAVGIICPCAGCKTEVDVPDIQAVLSPKEFEEYLEATLLAFVETDQLSVQCPNGSCQAVFSVVPFKGYDGPIPANELGLDDRPVTRKGWLHYLEHRIRCRACGTIFCAQCKDTPYHKGFTCEDWQEYQNAERCRFCEGRITEDNRLPDPPSPALERVCDSEECVLNAERSCLKTLACGCVCCGIRDEEECLPCLVHDFDEDQSEEMCAICYVEELQQAPSIQMTGECRHVFHLQCVREKIESRWNGARISFEFRACPVCKLEMYHPALAPLLADVLRLEHGVSLKALERLRYEGKHLDECLVQPQGDWYGEPLQYALHEFLFYMCHECKRPYFAGGYQCQEANDQFDPKELVCPACQPQSVNDCPVHGNEWLAYKCRFCCNIAQWMCWSNTHFCDKCHKSGVWQKLVTFRTGVNKKPIWEYPQCPSLVPQIQQIRSDRSLTDDQKTEKFQGLLSDHETCPLGVRHPPSGFEFGMGCTMCADGKGGKVARRSSILSDSDDDEKDEENEGDLDDPNDHKGTRRWLIRELTRFGNSGRQFDYSRDFDNKGVVHWLGCSGGRTNWANPHSVRQLVRVTSSSIMEDGSGLEAAVGQDVVRCVTRPEPESWFAFELVGLELSVTQYTLRHYKTWATECLRNWVFQGSEDGVQWHIISRHAQDPGLNGIGGTHTWNVDSQGRYFSHFRILQTGVNSNGNLYLPCSGFEMYGRLRPDNNQPAAAGGARAAAEIRQAPLQPLHRLVYQHDFDENGLMFWLGRDRGRSPQWRNPALEPSRVVARCSELASLPASAPVSAICGRETVRCVTAAQPNMWMSVELLDGLRLMPDAYTLKHYSSWNTECLRNWRLEASNDMLNWVILSEHVNDPALEGKGSTATWKLQNLAPGGPWRCFRVLMTGQNSNKHDFLALSGLEFYGQVFEVAAAPLQQQQQQVAAAVPAPGPQAGRHPTLLRWSGRSFDDQGLFHFLGRDWNRRANWSNPGEAPLNSVQVIFSSLAEDPPSAPPSAVLGKDVLRCVTAPRPNGWFSVELLTATIRPTHYSLRHYSTWDTECLRNWRLEASLDGMAWAVLMDHKNDTSLFGKGSSHTWSLPANIKPHYRWFRVVQTGPNSNKNDFLACSGFELYGEVMPVQPLQPVNEEVRLAQQQQFIAEQARHEEARQLQLFRGRPGYGEILPGIEFVPDAEQDPTKFDCKGFVYYFGTDQWTQPFRNPGQRGILVVDSSPLAQQPASEPAWAITGREVVRCVTLPSQETWFSVDFVRYAIRPTHYALRHYSSFDREALRNWVLEGSNNGKKWSSLNKHANDNSLFKKGMVHVWPVKKNKTAYRMFRIKMTGPNSNNNRFLALSGFEIYGKLTVAKK